MPVTAEEVMEVVTGLVEAESEVMAAAGVGNNDGSVSVPFTTWRTFSR
jgi:hypothetical protein